MYKITVYDDFLDREYTGEFGGTRKEAIADCKDFYAHELDTNPWDIKIVKIVHIV